MRKAPEATQEAHHPRKPLAQADLSTGGLGSESHQKHLLGFPVSSGGRPPGKETRFDCRGSFDASDLLSHAQSRHELR